ncbi:ORF21 [White sturgeon adenovirus 1]|uniref:ORF21 n=1 Tax=White sturgeon adenovirus 1 TaxID=2580388 RepID=A0A4V1F591_9ADEN|nr:ORF21 [White sturgeon adenovirus 1]QCQ84173.1 ORF21 [White sturgeon adenovirus 1]
MKLLVLLVLLGSGYADFDNYDDSFLVFGEWFEYYFNEESELVRDQIVKQYGRPGWCDSSTGGIDFNKEVFLPMQTDGMKIPYMGNAPASITVTGISCKSPCRFNGAKTVCQTHSQSSYEEYCGGVDYVSFQNFDVYNTKCSKFSEINPDYPEYFKCNPSGNWAPPSICARQRYIPTSILNWKFGNQRSGNHGVEEYAQYLIKQKPPCKATSKFVDGDYSQFWMFPKCDLCRTLGFKKKVQAVDLSSQSVIHAYTGRKMYFDPTNGILKNGVAVNGLVCKTICGSTLLNGEHSCYVGNWNTEMKCSLIGRYDHNLILPTIPTIGKFCKSTPIVDFRDYQETVCQRRDNVNKQWYRVAPAVCLGQQYICMTDYQFRKTQRDFPGLLEQQIRDGVTWQRWSKYKCSVVCNIFQLLK